MATHNVQFSKNCDPSQSNADDKGKEPYSGETAYPEGVAPNTPGGASEDDPIMSSMVDVKYVQELNVEKQTLDHETYPHSIRLLSHG